MWTHRIIYSFALAASAVFSVLYPFWFSWYLLVLLLLLAVFDLLISLPGMLKRRITFAAPRILEHGEDGSLVITTLADKPFPARCIKTLLNVAGDDFNIRRRFILSAENDSRYEVVIDTSRSGVTSFESPRVWTVSLIGLFCFPAQVNCRASVLVLPEPVKPPHIVALPRGVILRPKPGGGFSEDYDLRPYRKGDPVRSVHWKVSAKFDSLIIREPLIAPAHSRLVHCVPWNGARERDLIIGRLLWVSAFLLKWELAHYVRLGDGGPVAEITRTEELHDYLYKTLGPYAKPAQSQTGVPIRFAWVFRVTAEG